MLLPFDAGKSRIRQTDEVEANADDTDPIEGTKLLDLGVRGENDDASQARRLLPKRCQEIAVVVTKKADLHQDAMRDAVVV